MTGTVLDETGAVIPDAAVRIEEQRTGFTRSAMTNAQGNFTFPDITPGIYNVTITKGGFKEVTQSGVELNVASIANVRVTLPVGVVGDQITVEAGTVQVETQTGQIGNVILGTQIRELPLSGRNFVQLTTLVPGASVAENFDPKNKGLLAGVDISFSGAQATSNQWLVDGANNNDVGSQRTILMYPSIDSIEEFKILRNAYGPEFGQAGGAQVNIITRGGANSFAGSVYYYGRNDALNAKDYFLGFAEPGTPAARKQVLRRNDFGYQFGGPIKRDRIFFFWSQEWNIERRGAVRTALVPTALELQGDFTQTCPARQPNHSAVPGNVIPAGEISPAGRAYLSALPAPNLSGDPCAEFNWLAQVAVPIDWREESARGDITLTNNTKLMLRYAQNAWDNPVAFGEGGLWGSDKFPGVTDNWSQPARMAVAKLSTTFGATAVNDFQFSWSSNRIRIRPAGDLALRQQISSAFPTVFPASGKLNAGDLSYPVCWGGCEFGGPSGGVPGMGNISPWNNRQDLFVWRNDFSKVSGNHTIKLGILYDRNAKDEDFVSEHGGLWGAVGTNNTWNGPTNNQFANFLVRNMGWGYEESARNQVTPVRWRTLEFYAGDNWKIHPRLTLEYGARWSFLFNPFLANNNYAMFMPSAFDPAHGNSPCNGIVLAAGAPNRCQELGFAGGTISSRRSITANDKNAIAPRFGFAWDVFGNQKAVMRGGVGQFFARDRLLAIHVHANNAPFAIVGAGTRFLDPVDPAVGFQPGVDLFDGWGNSGQQRQGIDDDGMLANTWQWNLTTEVALWRDAKLEMGWVATRGVHLLTAWNINQITDPADRVTNAETPGAIPALHPFGSSARGAGALNIWGHRGDSIYHSFQSMFSNRFSRSSILQLAYTWSKNLGNASFGYVGVDQSIADHTRPRDSRGPVDFNRPHVFSANLVYELPELLGHPGLVRSVAGGWQLNSIVSWASGPALTINGGVSGFGSPSGTGSGSAFDNRPLRVHGEPCFVEGPDRRQRLNINAFTWDGYVAGSNSNTGPGQCQGAPTENVDFAFVKNWGLGRSGSGLFGERTRLQFRLELFNAFNRPQFRNVSTSFGWTGASLVNGVFTGGQPSGATLANFGKARNSSLRGNREIQYGLRLTF